MFRSGRNSVKEEKILDIGKGEIIKKLQNQSHNLTLDLESLKLCQKNLAFEKDLQEPAKIKLGYLLENMIDKIQEELEDIVRMINTLHHCHEVDDDILKEVDLLNLRYSKLALQTEKVFVSSPLFMELRTKGDISYMPLNDDLRNSNVKKADKSMREYITESPALKERHNRSFTAHDNDNRPYMKDTFNSRINKDLSSKKIESIDRNKSQRSIMKSPKRTVKTAFNEVNSEWIDDLLKQFGTEEEVNRHQKLTTASTKYLARAESPSLRQNIPKSAQTVTSTSRKTVFDTPPASDVVKREIQSLKNLYLELREKLDSHTHTDYETHLEKLRYENTKVISDNKVLQKDNSELMHTLFDIKKELKELKEENHKLRKDISRLKSSKEAAPQEEPKPLERLSVKREHQQSIQDQSRFLLPKTKNTAATEEEELAASWVKRRLA